MAGLSKMHFEELAEVLGRIYRAIQTAPGDGYSSMELMYRIERGIIGFCARHNSEFDSAQFSYIINSYVKS